MTEPIQTQAGDAFRRLLDTLAEIQSRNLSEEFGITDADSAAEGHRLLVHQLDTALSMYFEQDADHPDWRRIVEPHRKALGDNTDAIYFTAPWTDPGSAAVTIATPAGFFPDLVIAIDLNSDLLGRHLTPKAAPASTRDPSAYTPIDAVLARIQSGIAQLGFNNGDLAAAPPAMLDVLASSINIMQVLITRSRLAGEPADVMVTPLLAELGLMEFHRVSVGIEAGKTSSAASTGIRIRISTSSGGTSSSATST